MKRLTKRDGDEYITNCDNCPKHGSCYDSADCVSVLAERLGTYEDEAEKQEESHSAAAFPTHCKDCEEYRENPYDKNGQRWCMLWGEWLPVDPDNYCSYGKPRRAELSKANKAYEATESHGEAAILRGCIALMQSLVGRFEEYLDFIDFHPEDEEERFCTQFYMTEIVKRLFLWETTHSGGTSQRMKLRALGVETETVTFEDDRMEEDEGWV